MLPSSPIHSVQYTVTHFVSNPSSSTLNLKIFLFNKKIYIIVFLIKTKQNEKILQSIVKPGPSLPPCHLRTWNKNVPTATLTTAWGKTEHLTHLESIGQLKCKVLGSACQDVAFPCLPPPAFAFTTYTTAASVAVGGKSW